MKAFIIVSKKYMDHCRGVTQLTALDGETVIHEKPEILDGLANHFDQLLKTG